MRKITHLNGPLNIARVEGRIGKVNKVIYLFMDYHAPITTESKCDSRLVNINPLQISDFTEYLKSMLTELKNNEKTYDLFLEISKLYLQNDYGHVTRGRYIDETMDLFSQLFQTSNRVTTKANQKNTKVSKPFGFSNLRLHYFDMRDLVDVEIHSRINSNKELLDILFTGTRNASGVIMAIKTNCKRLIIIITDLIARYSRTYRPKDDLEKEMFKIIEKYHNARVKTEITKFLDSSYHALLRDALQYVTNITNIINTVLKDLKQYDGFLHKGVDKHKQLVLYGSYITDEQFNKMKQVDSLNKDLYDTIVVACANLVDGYAIRRILDKDYITKVIHYGGIAHAANIIWLLCNKFEFRVTHLAKMDGVKSLKDFNKAKNRFDVEIMLFPEKMYQCSDISSFPEKFE